MHLLEMGIASHFLGQSWDWAQFWEDIWINGQVLK